MEYLPVGHRRRVTAYDLPVGQGEKVRQSDLPVEQKRESES